MEERCLIIYRDNYFKGRIQKSVTEKITDLLNSVRKGDAINEDTITRAVNTIAAMSIRSDEVANERVALVLDNGSYYWQGNKDLSLCYEPDFE